MADNRQTSDPVRPGNPNQGPSPNVHVGAGSALPPTVRDPGSGKGKEAR